MNQQIEGMTADNPDPSRHHKEVRRAILRMTTNYIRLFLSVFIGLMLVRIIITHWDNDAWALIDMIGVN